MVKRKYVIEKFGGIDEHSNSLSTATSMVNLCVTKERKLKKRDVLKKVISLRGEEILVSWEGTIRGVECILFVTAGGFYKYLADIGSAIYLRPFTGTRAFAFEFSECVYILSDVDLYSFDGGSVSRVEGYSPLIAISTDFSGSCELFEAVNMLTPKRRQQFSSDGQNKKLILLEKNIQSIVSVAYLGERLDKAEYTFNSVDSTITLNEVYPALENSLEVEYISGADRRSEVLAFEKACVFGGGNDTRVFLFGNSDMPSYRRHSELGGGMPRADYFPENNFVSISGKVITSIIRHYDRQLIFCLDSTFYSVDEIQSDSLGAYYHSYPIYALNSEKGHIGGNGSILIKNEPISLTYDGIYRWVSTSVRDERNAIKISSNVDGIYLRFLSSRWENPIRLYDDDIRCELWVVCGDEALIYNYEINVWYFYSDVGLVTFSRCFDRLLLGKADGDVCVFEEGEEEIPIRYVSGSGVLGEVDTQKELGGIEINATSSFGTEMDISFMADGDGECKGTFCAKFGKALSRIFRRRLLFGRFRQLAFVLDGKSNDVLISYISFIIKERGRIF